MNLDDFLKLSLTFLKVVNKVFGNSNGSHQDTIKTSPEGDKIIKREMIKEALGNFFHDTRTGSYL